jgi:predicted O-linked N-acetylglucosamine transferase (SPINDLY family)
MTEEQTLTIQQAIDLAVQHHKAGDLSKAKGIYRQILQADPNQPVALHFLGLIAHQLGKNEVSVNLITKAITIKPDFDEACFTLGLVLQGLGELDKAVASYNKAIIIKPNYFKAHSNLGAALNDQGKLDEAVVSYNKAITIKPDYADAHLNLGITLQGLGRLEEAMASCNKALTINPDFAEAHNNLGNALKELGRLDEAVTSYNKALAVKPDYAEAYCNLSNVLQDQGNIEDAVNQLDLALSYKPEKSGWLTRKALFLPAIPYSQEDIINRRKELSETVLALQDKKLIVEDPLVDIGSTNFYLAYHGQNNRSIMESIAKLHISVCPKLTFEAEHCRRKQVRKDGRLQIGFLSSYFKEHSVGKLSRGLIEHFSREIFEVIVFHLPGKKDAVTEAIVQSADRSVLLSRNLEKDRVSIAEQELDCLLYLDIGMDPYTYFLSFARLAPVQAMTWGHPDTTGIPNIDYFISSDSIEPPEASRHYTETLIKLSLMPTYLYYPDIPTQNYERAGFSLKNQGSLYLCPQSLFKLHPSYDATLAELLRSDPEGLLIFIDDNKGGHWKKLFIERLSRSYPDVVDRVTFVPKMPYEKFLGLLSLADAILDVPTFSGGVSSLEAFAMGAPIVTWPGEFMRGRVTSGYYKQMGLDDLIASNENEYVSLAIKLAHDPDFKNQMKNDIKENSHKLFERIEVVREMENFFLSAYEQMCEG